RRRVRARARLGAAPRRPARHRSSEPEPPLGGGGRGPGGVDADRARRPAGNLRQARELAAVARRRSGQGADARGRAPRRLRAPPRAERVKVAAAADLAFAFPDVGALYEKTTGERVVFSFGSTGLLERQLAEGAPFDAFAAASASFADDAVKSGACLADSKASYATGRLVVLVGN